MDLREKILQAEDVKKELVPVEEWDVSVEVRGMSGRQRALLLQDAVDNRGNVDLQKAYPQLLIMSIFDPETGQPVFQAGDADALSEKNGAAIEKIAMVATRLSGLDVNAGKNSDSTPSASSTSK